jgi:hypothetical protein
MSKDSFEVILLGARLEMTLGRLWDLRKHP